MAKELFAPGLVTGQTYQAKIYSDAGQVFNGSTFENWADGNLATYLVAMTELGTSGTFAADLPAALSAIVHYNYAVTRRVGGSGALTDPVSAIGQLGPSTGLLSSGTGAGQLDFTSGVVKSNLVQILASAITGTAAQLAAAFTKFFNVASPTGTANSLPDAVPGAANGVAIVGSAMALTSGERTATANEVEAQIIDETDSEKVLAAITDKIAAVNPSLSGLTLAAIASAVRDVLNTGPAANSLGAAINSAVSSAASAASSAATAATQSTTAATQATTAATNSTTILARLGAWTGTGINSILGALRAICGKTAALTPSDITAAATTFDNTTDALEALRDRGDAAWTSGTAAMASGTVASTTGTTTTLDNGASATADKYVGERLVLLTNTGSVQSRIITAYSVGRVATHAAWTVNPDATTTYAIHEARATADLSSNVTVTPVVSMVTPAGELVSQPIKIQQYDTTALTFVLLDTDGDAINDSGDSFKLVVYKLDKITVIFEETGTAGGVNGNQIPVIVDDAHTTIAGSYWYKLINVTEDVTRAENSFEVEKGPKPALYSGTVVSTTGTATTLDSGLPNTVDLTNGMTLVIQSGPGVQQKVVITDQLTGRVVIHAAWAPTNPTSASTWAIYE